MGTVVLNLCSLIGYFHDGFQFELGYMACDNHFENFRGSFPNLQQALVTVEPLDMVFAQESNGPMNLQRFIGHLPGNF
jgi:hypothetical protein